MRRQNGGVNAKIEVTYKCMARKSRENGTFLSCILSREKLMRAANEMHSDASVAVAAAHLGAQWQRVVRRES